MAVVRFIKRNLMSLSIPIVLLIILVVYMVYQRKKVAQAAKNAVSTLSSPDAPAEPSKPDPKASGNALVRMFHSGEDELKVIGNSIESFYEKIRKKL